MDYAPLVILEGVNGETFTLSSRVGAESVFLAKGPKGLDMLPYDVQVDEFPALDGEYPRAVRGLSREVFLPLIVYGNTRTQTVAAKRRLMRALNPARFGVALPKLVVAEPTANGGYETKRELEVYYSSGMEGDEGSDNGLVWNKFGLILRSTDPYFRDRADIVGEFYTYGSLAPFFPRTGPFLSADGVSGGFQISSAPVASDTISVNNPGDVGVYPTWTIVGPVTGPFNLVREATTFSPRAVLQITSDFSIASGQVATITTDVGKRDITGSVGASVGWNDFATNPQFWTVDPGPNVVSVENLVGANAQQFTLAFRGKYMGM